MEKQVVAYPHNGIVFRHENKQQNSSDTCYNRMNLKTSGKRGEGSHTQKVNVTCLCLCTVSLTGKTDKQQTGGDQGCGRGGWGVIT